MRNQTLLIVDDSPDTQDLVQAWLAGETLDFISCSDGEQAVQLARTAQPDLILLDVHLPRCDGFQVCTQLKADPATAMIPVVFLTGASSTEEKLQGLELGAQDYIVKPFDPAELRARVRSALQTRRLLDELAQKAATLQVSEERFRLLAENSSDVICRLSPDGVYLYVSPASATILGYPPDALQGRNMAEFVLPEDRNAARACYCSDRGPGVTGRAEYRFRTAAGPYRWLESTCRGLFDPATGVVREIHASVRDINGRKQMESREQARAEVLGMIAEGRPLDDIFRRLIDEVEREEAAPVSAGVMVSASIVHHCAPRLKRALAEQIEKQMPALVARFDTLAAGDCHRVVLCDLLNDPAWESLRPQLLEHGLRCCFAILIRNPHGPASGVFVVYRTDPPQTAAAPSDTIMKLASDLAQIAVEHRQLDNRLTFQAQHDTLTQLPNRALFSEQLPRALAVAQRTGRSAATLLVDVDGFKHINDTYGHQAGDEMLCQVAQRLAQRMRATDLLARMGGDEFAMLLVDLAHPDDAARVAATMVDEFRKPIDLQGRKQFISVSIGSATFPRDGHDPMSLLKNADLALYVAKDSGRNTARAFRPEMGENADERMALDETLRHAVAGNQLRLFYQPKVDASGRIVSLEALIRWDHPTMGMIPPGRFIPLAEDNGTIIHLERWALHETCRQIHAWQADGVVTVPISVNVSALQFAQPDFVDIIAATISGCGMKQDWLTLELTETLLMQNIADSADKVRRLRQLQVRVAVDDFGTGYSSLAYLHRLSVQTLKIDRSFITPLQDGPDGHSSQTIVRAIVAMAKNLGLEVVAEGVETEVQRKLALAAGCDLLQGFLFSRPRPANEIEAMLRLNVVEIRQPLALSA
jgi:diguanylate cyclase (GGDEF)-like protein/PAS domain S-box-containing protein